MAPTHGYVETDALRARIGQLPEDAGTTARLDAVITAASRSIDKYCDRRFWLDDDDDEATPVSRVYVPRCGDDLLVDDFDPSGDIEVKTDEDADGIFETTWSESDFEGYPRNPLVDGPGAQWRIIGVGTRVFPMRRIRPASVEVTAIWGWSEVPAEVAEACYVLAEDLFQLKDAPFGVAGANDFGVLRIRVNPFLQMLLDPLCKSFGIV